MKKLYVPRQIEKRLKRSASQFPVLVLTGPRQSGKSTLLQKTFPRHRYGTLDDPFQRDLAIKDPLSFLENLGEPAVIDEIQYVPGLLPYLKMAVDRDRSKNGRFLLTGSQVFPLMAGIGESLAGRAVLHELLGFSCVELGDRVRAASSAACFELLFRGFFPEPAVHGVEANDFYRSYLQTYLERDIRQIRTVHDLHLFQNFLELLAARAGGILKLSEVAKECGISHTTAGKWLSLLETTRLIYLLRPYARNLSKRVVKSPKLYFTDTGLLAFLLKYPDARTLLAGPAAGAIFENFILIEILKYKFNSGGLFEPYFYRDSNQNEIDLVLDFGRSLKFLEIKLARTLRREFFASLRRTAGVFDSGKSYLVTMSPEPIEHDGVSARNWREIAAIVHE
jgi:predicted AAA+ superfamily ATPase